MEYLIGAILALGVGGFAAFVGLDRERAFYSTVLIVVGSYYVLFAAMGPPDGLVVGIETVIAIAFLLMAALGFKTSSWLLVAGLIGHGVFDSVHHLFIQNQGMPRWWPGFCLAYDVTAGVWLAFRLVSNPTIYPKQIAG